MSFQQGLSGLNASSKNLEVIGNNVANSGTFGAKASRAEFADLYASAMNGSGGNNVGIGVTVAAVTQQFTQGNVTTSANSLDVAIKGDGFFEVSDGTNPPVYTRNGQFQIDKNGFVVTNTGLKLMGYLADDQGVIQPGAAVPLQMPTAGIAPSATTKNTVEMNLDARRAITLPAAAPQIDFDDAASYNDATSVTVYDARGQNMALSYYFQKASVDAATGGATWNVYATANGASVGGAAANPLPVTALVFPANGGAPSAGATGSFTIPASVDANGVATLAVDVAYDFGKSTNYGSPFGITNLAQNGYTAGKLNGVTIESGGVLTRTYSNGQTLAGGQIEMATFRNPQGLKPLGGNAWARSFTSGDPIVGTPGGGNLGVLQSGALEESNVDLTAELVSMMTAQRTYQANAQTIKTQDQVLQTLVNLR